MYDELKKIPTCLENMILEHRVKVSGNNNQYYCCDSRHCNYKNTNDNKNYCLAYETKKNGFRRV